MHIVCKIKYPYLGDSTSKRDMTSPPPNGGFIAGLVQILMEKVGSPSFGR